MGSGTLEHCGTDWRIFCGHRFDHDAHRLFHVLDGTQPEGIFKLFRDFCSDFCRRVDHTVYDRKVHRQKIEHEFAKDKGCLAISQIPLLNHLKCFPLPGLFPPEKDHCTNDPVTDHSKSDTDHTHIQSDSQKIG